MRVTPSSTAGRPPLLGEPAFKTDQAGHKAATLHELAMAGFAVPPAFVIEPHVDMTLYTDDTLAGWVAACGGFPVAVRSSGVIEDLDDASFAGLYESYLDVDDVPTLRRRISDCRDSAAGERVLAYLKRHEIDPNDALVSVLVQRLVPADVAGVGFTIDPVTGIEEHALVEWCAGLGDRLVSGRVDPSRAVLRLADGVVVQSDTGQDGATLSVAQTAELAELLLRIQANRHRPQDVEWAIDCDGRLWVLQARAITTIAWRTDINLLTDADFRDGGISARVCTPLMFSLYRNAFENSMQSFWVGLRLLDPDLKPSWIEMHYGRAYWNVDAVKDRYATVPGYDELIFDTDLGIDRDYVASGGPRRTPITVRTVIGALPVATALARGYRRQLAVADRFATDWPTTYASWRTRAQRLPEIDDATFVAELVECLLSLHPAVERAYFTTIYYNTSVQSDFKRLLEKVDGATGEKTPMIELMGGLSNISHMALQSAIVELYQVAEISGFDGAQWHQALTNFLDVHGFHADIELELTCPRWSEQPERVRELIQAMIVTKIRPIDPGTDLVAQRSQYETQLLALHNRIRQSVSLRLRFGRAIDRHISRMRRYLVAREQMREFSSQCYAIVRTHVLEAGRRLTANGRLSEETDIFMLFMDEIADLAQGRLTGTEVADRINVRRAMYDGYRDLTPPHELGGVAEMPTSDAPIDAAILSGLGCSPGIVEGAARVISSLTDISRLSPGDILVTQYTDPGWTPALGMVAGVVTEVGGLLSHAAVIGREYGIPAVLNVTRATQVLRSGQRIRVDGGNGQVTVLAQSENEENQHE